MRNCYSLDTITTIDVCEILKMGGNVIEIYEGVFYRENSKVSPFRKVTQKMFSLGQKYKDDKKYLMQRLNKLIMNSLYGVQIGKIVVNHIIVNRKLG